MTNTVRGDALQRLNNWYAAQCNGDWEHGWGIRMQTLDNPGWEISIDLENTYLEDTPFAPVRSERSESDFMELKLENKSFRGYCSTMRLEEMLQTFLDWAERESAAE